MALDLEAVNRSMRAYAANEFTISCGTVTMDVEKSKILLIWNKRLEIFQLPKGRKNIGEDMIAAALRETVEETGVTPKPLSLLIATRATVPVQTTEESGQRPRSEVTTNVYSNEMGAVCEYPDPQSATPATKMVYFFAASADSTATKGETSPEDRDRISGVWVKASEAAQTLRFTAESHVVKIILSYARNSGYRMDG